MDKLLVRGIAIGIICSTIIYGLIYYKDKPKDAITEQQVENYLKKNEFVKISKDKYEELLKEKNNDKEIVEKPPSTTEQPKKEEKKPEEITFVLTIEPGMNSDQIADLLQKNGIISNASTFNQYLIEKGRSTGIQLGTFKLSSKMSIEEIANMISK